MSSLTLSQAARLAGPAAATFALLYVTITFTPFGRDWSPLTGAAVAVGGVLLLSLAATPRGGDLGPMGRIREQLAGAARPGRLHDLLEPVTRPDDVSRGWNAVVEQVRGSLALAELERRVEEKFSRSRSVDDAAVLNSLAEGVCVTDASGRCSFANSALAALLGADAAALANADIAEHLPPDLPESTREAIGRVLPVAFEARRTLPHGEVCYRWSRRPIIDAAGEATGHVWSVRDVTQAKLAEKMRDEFLSMATHELRTPLTNISAYAETLMMADDIDVEQQKQFYNVIQAEANRLSRFVDELLDVSRMEAGSVSIDRRETNVERLVLDACDKVRPEMNRKRLRFLFNLPPKLPAMKLDKDAMAAALVNLLGNAAKYTPEGGAVTFTVAVADREIRFAVEDTGIGIAAEEIPRVFEKFYRSGDDRVREINGSGLGLAFTQEVARLHQGRIDVASELNKGSTFTLVLPLPAEGTP